MKIKPSKNLDADLAGVGPALARAAAKAKLLAQQTGTPFYVMKAGHIVDLNSRSSRPKLRRAIRAGAPK